MENLSQQKQTKEFCEPAVRLAYEQKLTTPQAASGLSMSDQTTDLDAAVTRLKCELTAAHMECDILKRAVAYFAKAKLRGSMSFRKSWRSVPPISWQEVRMSLAQGVA